MLCPKCGKELPDNARFCGGCGADVYSLVQQNVEVKQPSVPETRGAQATAQSQKPATDERSDFSKLHGKPDNSNSTLLKERSIWDVVGLCAAILMAICFFLPALTASTFSGTSSVSLASLMSLAGSSSYTSSLSWLLLIYLFPAVCCAIDLLVTKENSSRHVRLIVLGLLNMLLQSSILPIGKFISSFGGSLGIGFYLNMLASLVIIAVGIMGIIERQKA